MSGFQGMDVFYENVHKCIRVLGIGCLGLLARMPLFGALLCSEGLGGKQVTEHSLVTEMLFFPTPHLSQDLIHPRMPLK